MEGTGDAESAKRPRVEVDHGADAENGDEVHVPLQDGQLEEEEDDDDAADDADVPAAAAGAEDGGVLPKLVASDYGTNSPTSKGVRRTSITGKGTWCNIKRIKVKGEGAGASGAPSSNLLCEWTKARGLGPVVGGWY